MVLHPIRVFADDELFFIDTPPMCAYLCVWLYPIYVIQQIYLFLLQQAVALCVLCSFMEV